MCGGKAYSADYILLNFMKFDTVIAGAFVYLFVFFFQRGQGAAGIIIYEIDLQLVKKICGSEIDCRP